MISIHRAVDRKIFTVALAVLLGVGIFANTIVSQPACGALCCAGGGATLTSRPAPGLSLAGGRCCCSDTANFPCEYAGGMKMRLSPPALLRAHLPDHPDLTADRTELAATPANSPETARAPAVLWSASILKVPIYLTTLTLLC